MNELYASQSLADEIQEMADRHQLDGQVVTGGIAIILAKYGLAAERSSLMTAEQLIEQVSAVAKSLAKNMRSEIGTDQ